MDDILPRIAVITVNWNRPALTEACYDGLQATTGVAWHVFVVDNGSTDDSVDRIGAMTGPISLIDTGINSGWAGGNNRGIRAALAAGFDWLFLLNNDAIVSPTTLHALWTSAAGSMPSPPIVGAVQQDDDEDGNFFGMKETPDSVFQTGLSRAEFDAQPDIFPTAFIKGAAIFCHRSHIDRIGLFDERFFLNFEEVDWCVRARAAGIPVVMNKRATIAHRGSGSMGGYSSPISTYFLVRNGLLYAELHGTLRQRFGALQNRLEWAQAQFGTRSNVRAILRTLRSSSPWATAFKLAVRDYALRRFGDCPAIIRTITYAGKS